MTYPHISINPNICHGQACIKGTRIPVHQIIHTLANGDTIEELLIEYPSLEPEDSLTCLTMQHHWLKSKLHPLKHWRVQYEDLLGRKPDC
ncbi:MAG: hypothetical protein C5S49_00625 [Candidatus Methanogaster sp.]|nr:MAG: hypothetical protein C5S49_00625 [ANME-2 cluster archaeon]